MARKRRRQVLGLLASAGSVALAGCSGGGGNGGGGDGGSGNDGSGGGGGSDTEYSGTTDVTFYASVAPLKFQNNQMDKFGTLNVTFDRIALTTESGEKNEVSLGKEVDLAAIAGNEEKSITDGTKVASGSVPAGGYVESELFVSVGSATRADGSDVSLDVNPEPQGLIQERNPPLTENLDQGTGPEPFRGGESVNVDLEASVRERSSNVGGEVYHRWKLTFDVRPSTSL